MKILTGVDLRHRCVWRLFFVDWRLEVVMVNFILSDCAMMVSSGTSQQA